MLFLTGARLNLGGVALFASKVGRGEQPWTLGGAIYVTLLTVAAIAMIYLGLTVHWYEAW